MLLDFAHARVAHSNIAPATALLHEELTVYSFGSSGVWDALLCILLLSILTTISLPDEAQDTARSLKSNKIIDYYSTFSYVFSWWHCFRKLYTECP